MSERSNELIIIGLGARSGVGKDHLAGKMREKGLVRASFAIADQLKSIFDPACLLAYDKRCAELSGYEKEEFRPILVSFSERIAKPRKGRNVWFDTLANKIKAIQASHEKFPQDSLGGRVVFVTDIRFENEAEGVKALGGYNVYVDAPIPPANKTEAEHAPLVKAMSDFIIYNDLETHGAQITLFNIIRELINKNK